MPKPQKNALTFYIQMTLMPELQRQGRVFPNGIADVIPIACERFKKLPAHERQRYETMAKEHKKTRVFTYQRDNVGNLITERRDPKAIMMQKRRDDRQLMRNQLGSLSTEALLQEKIYVIGCEYMVQVEETGDYLPVEVGLVEWSMATGVLRTLHQMINPGDIPLGYRHRAQEQSDETHHIPIDRIAEGDSNYRGLWIRMENFVTSPDPDGRKKPVYCLEHENEKIIGCLAWLHEHAQCGTPNRFEVRFLEDLGLELLSHKNIMESCIRDMLTSSVFDYEPNVCCPFHTEIECKHCALGAAKRYTFALSDSLADVYNFELTPNHIPVKNANTRPSIVIESNKQQMIPETKPATGFSVRSNSAGSFGARDVRYYGGGGSVAGSAAGDVAADDDAYGDTEDDRQGPFTTVGAPRYAGGAFGAPAPHRLPNPAFGTVAGGVPSGPASQPHSRPICPPPTRPLAPPAAIGRGAALAGSLSQPVMNPGVWTQFGSPPASSTGVPPTSSGNQSSSRPAFYSAEDADDDDDDEPAASSRMSQLSMSPSSFVGSQSASNVGGRSSAAQFPMASSSISPALSFAGPWNPAGIPQQATGSYSSLLGRAAPSPFEPILGRGAGRAVLNPPPVAAVGRGVVGLGAGTGTNGVRPPPGFAGRGKFMI